MRFGDRWPQTHDLGSLRLLGTVGEPINPEAWKWYGDQIGRNRCPIVDTWWQTETGMIMISPLPGATPLKPGSATLPLPGVAAEIVSRDGSPVTDGSKGFLVVRKPWPAMLAGIYGDPERYIRQYWSEIPGTYFTGDGAFRDGDNYFRITGRVDDVMNVSGHRLSSAELESALAAHPSVAEASVVAAPDPLKGQVPYGFVVLQNGVQPTEALRDELRQWVASEIGPLARPEVIRFVGGLPKTRSGKIVRRLLRELLAKGSVQGDTTTLEDLSVLSQLAASDEGSSSSQ